MIIVMINKKHEIIQALKQFIKFGIVGVSNTIISLSVYYLLVFINVHYIIANSIAFIVSVINAYYWNSKYVFKSVEERTIIKSFTKVIISYGFTFVLGTVLMVVWVDFLKISNLIAPILNLFVTIPLNFVLNKHWAMK